MDIIPQNAEMVQFRPSNPQQQALVRGGRLP